MKCDWFHGVYDSLNKKNINRDQHSVHVNHPFKIVIFREDICDLVVALPQSAVACRETYVKLGSGIQI